MIFKYLKIRAFAKGKDQQLRKVTTNAFINSLRLSFNSYFNFFFSEDHMTLFSQKIRKRNETHAVHISFSPTVCFPLAKYLASGCEKLISIVLFMNLRKML